MEHGKEFCQGFKASGVISGVKKRGGKDVGLIYSEVCANAAGVFTNNLIKAAPVLLDLERIKKGKCQAIVANSGNANCCTGEKGFKSAVEITKNIALKLGISEELILIGSTGVIGEILPAERINDAVPELISSLSSKGFDDFAMAIMTTDTFPKTIIKTGEIDGKKFTVAGVAKGAGMIRPDMATLLCFVCTDVHISSDLLQNILLNSVNNSFNKITIDGDTSTNDTVLIMANGVSGIAINEIRHIEIFQKVLDEALVHLAKEVIRDGEGATKFVEIVVNGALTDRDAYTVAQTVANSNLVKTALFGQDANWGRILAAIGRSGVDIISDKVDIRFDDILMVKNSIGNKELEPFVDRVFKQKEFTIGIDLNMGNGKAFVFTCDLSIDYVKINADYRT